MTNGRNCAYHLGVLYTFLDRLFGRRNGNGNGASEDIEARIDALESSVLKLEQERTAWALKMDSLCRRIEKRLLLGTDRHADQAAEMSRRQMAIVNRPSRVS